MPEKTIVEQLPDPFYKHVCLLERSGAGAVRVHAFAASPWGDPGVMETYVTLTAGAESLDRLVPHEFTSAVYAMSLRRRLNKRLDMYCFDAERLFTAAELEAHLNGLSPEELEVLLRQARL